MNAAERFEKRKEGFGEKREKISLKFFLLSPRSLLRFLNLLEHDEFFCTGGTDRQTVGPRGTGLQCCGTAADIEPVGHGIIHSPLTVEIAVKSQFYTAVCVGDSQTFHPVGTVIMGVG